MLGSFSWFPVRDNPDNLTMREMGDKFGVSLETVKNIKYKKTWKHIEIPT